jgi:hypothetical protein
MVSLLLDVILTKKGLHLIHFVPCFDCFCFNRGFGLSVTFLPPITLDSHDLTVHFHV